MGACRSVGVAESVLRRWVEQLQLERRGVTPPSKALPPEQQRIQELEARIDRLERENAILKTTALLRDRTYALIEQLAKGESIALLCALFELPRSCLYAYRQRRQRVDPIGMSQRSRVHELFVESRSSAGSHNIMGTMREQGIAIGRFKVSRLMTELELICKQPGSHAHT